MVNPGYDDENQLVNWYYYGGGYDGEDSVTSSEDWRTDFVYDGRGRLRQRVEYQASVFGSNWEWVAEVQLLAGDLAHGHGGLIVPLAAGGQTEIRSGRVRINLWKRSAKAIRRRTGDGRTPGLRRVG
jgi:hypothetical protein